MGTYHVQTPDGAEYNIEAASDEQANAAVDSIMGGPSDLERMGKNIIPDAIQTGADMATSPAIDLIGGNPIPLAKSAFEQGKQILSDPVGAAKSVAAPVTHPIDFAIEHPVQQAMNVAGLVAPMVAPAAETMAKYAGRMGENQMGKLHGTSANQFRQLGRENFGDVMRTSYEHGDANLLQGSIGREQAIKERIAQIGNDIGDMRAQASEGGPAMSGKEMADAIRAKIGPEYAEGGAKFADAAEFEKQLANIEKMPSTTPSDFAQRSTDINADAKGKALIQPTGAQTDVANSMSHVNDEAISKRLPPELQEHYETLKEEFGATKPLDPMELRGEAKEALANQPGTAFSMAKKALHTITGGPKMGAQAGFIAEKALNAVANHGAGAGVAGITSGIMSRITSNPQSLGKFAAPLMQAAQSGGQQGIAALHFVLSHQYPEYNDMFMGDKSDESGQ